jgi:hypothetical protein
MIKLKQNQIILLNSIINDKYSLIGIGDFSHGDNNIWEYRLDLLKNVIKNTNKNVIIFNEDTEKHCINIMDISKELVFEETYGVYKKKFAYGPLDNYAFRVYDSPIYLEIIKYIRLHIKRITIIGVDNEQLTRDRHMAKLILKKLDKTKINFFWAHNDHVDNRRITQLYETAWHDEKYRSGYYLKEKLGNKYIIILSTGYKGKIRFDGICNNEKCSIKTLFDKPTFKDFIIPKYSKYYNGLYKIFNENIAEFSQFIFPKNIFMIKTRPDYVLFFKEIRSLELIKINEEITNKNILLDSVLNELRNIVKKFKGYGIISVFNKNKLIYEKTFGYANFEIKKKWTQTTKHHIGSVTKVFTTLAIMLLVQEEKLKLTDTINKFGLERIPNSNKIKVTHLIKHTSGIYNSSYDHYYRGKNHDFNLDPKNIPPLDIKDMIQDIINHGDCFKKYPNECFEPGTKYNYSNTGYYLLAYIIEYITKTDPRMYIRYKILLPLKMYNTTFFGVKSGAIDYATKVYQSDGRLGYEEKHGIHGLNGNMISTSKDLNKFLIGYEKLLNKDLLKILKTFYFWKNNVLVLGGQIDYDDKLYNVSNSSVRSKYNINTIFLSNKPEKNQKFLNYYIEKMNKVYEVWFDDFEIVVQIDDKRETFDNLLELLKDIKFLREKQVNVILPSNKFFNVLAKNPEKIKNIDKDRYFNIFLLEVYKPTPTKKVQQIISNAKKFYTLIFDRLKELEKNWGFKLFDKYKIILNIWGTGGAYDYESGIIMTRVDENGIPNASEDPFNYTIVHEIVHMGIEEIIVKKYDLRYWEKEILVDMIAKIYLGDLMPKYNIQGRNKIMEKFVNYKSIVINLPKAIEKYKQTTQKEVKLELPRTQKEMKHIKKITQNEIKLIHSIMSNNIKEFNSLICQTNVNFLENLPIIVACEYGKIDIVKKLLTYKNVDMNDQHHLAFILSSKNGHLKVLKYLWPHRSNDLWINYALKIAKENNKNQITDYLKSTF